MRQLSRKTWVIILAVVVVLAVAIISLATGRSTPTGALHIYLQLPDYDHLSLTLNDKEYKVVNLQPAYLLAPGSYHIAVTKPGYQDFTADFTIAVHQTTTVNVTMTRSSTPAAITPNNKVIANVEVPGVTVTNAVYFYDRTWAFITIQSPDGNIGLMVVKYDDPSASWKGVVGPGTAFGQSDLIGLPDDVVTYLQQHNYIIEEDSP